MTLRERIAWDAKNTLTRADHLGEAMVLRVPGETARTVYGTVRRASVLDASEDHPGEAIAIVRVFLCRDATAGLTRFVEGIRIDLPVNVGETVRTCAVRALISESPGGFVLEVAG